MCDTLVALGNSTLDGTLLFAKNSDREPNEAHELVLAPAADHAAGSSLRCTYIDVPQVQHTYAVLLAKPFWIWGGEMGANEHQVVIGNEAVFTRVPYEKTPGLIGMDFLRLALERSETAAQALKQITSLLAQYGQGGNCGFQHAMFYHNSFIIADRTEAWVLETAGREWAAEQVKDVRSISNVISIGAHWDLASEGLVETAIQNGWCKSAADFDFSRCYSDPLYTRLSDAGRRQVCTSGALLHHRGKLTPGLMMAFLRSHERSGGRPDATLTGADVCMHAGFGPLRGSQSTGSMVSQVGPDGSTHWLTGTSAPCTSVFKPVWLDAGLPDVGPAPVGEYNPDTLFWQHERLHREILRDYRTRLGLIQLERDALEERFLQSAQTGGLAVEERCALSADCFSEAARWEAQWLERVRCTPLNKRAAFPYRVAWKQFNRQARME